MSKLEDNHLLSIYRGWTGKTLKTGGKLPRRGETAKLELASPLDLELVDQEFANRGLGEAQQAAFLRRQLRGRTEIRTRADAVRVLGGLRAMNRRERNDERPKRSNGGNAADCGGRD